MRRRVRVPVRRALVESISTFCYLSSSLYTNQMGTRLGRHLLGRSVSRQSIPVLEWSRPAVGMLSKPRYEHTTRAVSMLDRMPLFIATWADDVSVQLRSGCPRQRAARRRAFSVAFLSAVSAAAIHRLAAGVRCFVRRVGAGHGSHGGRGGGDADADGVSRRSLRRAAVSGRRDPFDDPVDRGDGAGDRLLAGGRAGAAVGGRQFGYSPGGLRDPQ